MNLTNVINDIIRLVNDNKKKISRRAIERLIQLVREDAQYEQRNSSNNEPIIKTDLREILSLTLAGYRLANRTPTPPQPGSWATVAARAASSDKEWQPKMVIPARRSKKLIIREDGADANLRNRTFQNITQAVNTATNGNNIIIAKTMLNDDVVIIFRNDAEPKITNVNWVTKAFGKSANLAKKKLAIIAKNLSITKLRNTYNEAELAIVLH
jgi:hypothetical protein